LPNAAIRPFATLTNRVFYRSVLSASPKEKEHSKEVAVACRSLYRSGRDV